MKICFVCNEYPPMPGGGIGVFVQTLAEALTNLGVDICVVGYGRKAQRSFVQNGVKIFWLSLPNFLQKSVSFRGYPYSIASIVRRHILSLRLDQLVREQHIDVVESHDFSGPLAFKPTSKLVVRLHGSVVAYRLGEGRPQEIHPIDRHYEIRNLQIADSLVAVSHYIGDLTGKAVGHRLDFQVIYNGVDTSVFTPNPGLGDGSILFVGNVMWRKGVFDLIKAMPLVLERYPTAQLNIVGGVGGVHQEHLKESLGEISETDRGRVKLLGRVSRERLPALYHQASVVVFPSRVEAFGLTCAEAMACGRPVIATSRATGPELVEDGVSGLLADPTNVSDLAAKINRLLGDASLATRLGVNAHKRVRDKFTLDDLGPRNLAYYQSLL